MNTTPGLAAAVREAIDRAHRLGLGIGVKHKAPALRGADKQAPEVLAEQDNTANERSEHLNRITSSGSKVSLNRGDGALNEFENQVSSRVISHGHNGASDRPPASGESP